MSKICFVGAGNMAEAIIGGILDSKLFSKDDITAIDISEERLKYIYEKFFVKTVLNTFSSLKKAEIVILSVKPQSLTSITEELKNNLNEKAMVISILAGVKIKKIEELLNSSQKNPLVRVMPNLGAFVRKSVSALTFNDYVSDNNKKIAKQIFSSIGYVHEVLENDIDKITAVSGSGPAYIFYFMEAFMEGAEKLEVSSGNAEDLCLETLEGAFELLKIKKDSAKLLREKVTSKGGTTEAAIKTLNDNNFKSIVINALKAAFNRAKELGEN